MGLRGEDFQVSEEGKRQKVTLFSGERRPLRIALALDVSGSMDNKIRQVEEALRHFIDLLEPADEILVLTFNDHVHVVQDFTSDRELLGRVLDKLEPRGSDRALRCRLRGHPAGGRGTRGEQGGRPRHRRRRHRERDVLRRPARARPALGGAGLLDRPRRRTAGSEDLLPPGRHGHGRRPGARWRGPRRMAGRARRLAGRGRTWRRAGWRRRTGGAAGGPAGGPGGGTSGGLRRAGRSTSSRTTPAAAPRS